MTLFPEEPPSRLAEHAGLKCWLRPGTSDEDVWRENILDEEAAKHLRFLPGQKWLDIGGYIGTFALYALQRECQVVSFEPFPKHVDLYRANLELNGYKPLVVAKAILQAPVSNKAEYVLPLPAQKRGNRFINHAKGTLISRWSKPHPHVTVPVISFAKAQLEATALLGRSGSWNLKLDAEGPEGDILEYGDLSMFQQIFWEYHYAQADPTYERAPRIIQRMKDLGFNIKLSKPLRPPRWWNDSAFLGWATRS